LRYDNLSAAVKKILRGRQRVETERIIGFRSHWGFRGEYCNPARGNEKGGVERGTRLAQLAGAGSGGRRSGKPQSEAAGGLRSRASTHDRRPRYHGAADEDYRTSYRFGRDLWREAPSRSSAAAPKRWPHKLPAEI